MAADYSTTTHDHERARHLSSQREDARAREAANGEGAARLPLSSHALRGRANTSMRAAMFHSAQQVRGNRSVQRSIRRTASSTAPPSLNEDAIAKKIEAKSGSGSKLEEQARGKLEEGLGADLSHVRV